MTLPLRQRLSLLFFAAFLVAAWAWVSANRVPWTSGTVRILVLEVLAADSRGSDGLTRWNGRAPSAHASLDTAAAWLAQEYARYAPTAPPLDVEFVVSGPHRLAVDPPDLDDPGLGPWGYALRAFSFYWYFRTLSKRLGADFDDFDARIVVLLERGRGDLEALSMADRKQRFGVVRLDPAIPDPTYACVTLLHELGHTLGATDKYDPEGFLATWPEGFVAPRAEPLYPQVFAEIMAVDVPVGPAREREPSALREVRVGARTAAEFGWIPPRLADEFYEGLPSTPR